MESSLETSVLVLNRVFQPIRVVSARRAFVMLYLDVARALDRGFFLHDFQSWRARGPTNGDDAIRTISSTLAIPRVVVLQRYDRVPRATVRLSRRNVFLRDAHTCQYCGRNPP